MDARGDGELNKLADRALAVRSTIDDPDTLKKKDWKRKAPKGLLCVPTTTESRLPSNAIRADDSARLSMACWME